jgi:hypothetical protein
MKTKKLRNNALPDVEFGLNYEEDDEEDEIEAVEEAYWRVREQMIRDRNKVEQSNKRYREEMMKKIFNAATVSQITQEEQMIKEILYYYVYPNGLIRT